MLDPAKPVDNLVKSEFSGVIQISLTSAACTVEIKNKKIINSCLYIVAPWLTPFCLQRK
jgi:hypothetical protein